MACLFLEVLPVELRRKIYTEVLKPPIVPGTSRTYSMALSPRDPDAPLGVYEDAPLPYDIYPYDLCTQQTLPYRVEPSSLLQTCKQLYVECKDLQGRFWHYNSLAIPHSHLMHYSSRAMYAAVSRSVRRVEMAIYLTSQSDAGDTERALRLFSTWRRDGPLETVVLVPLWSREAREDLMHVRMLNDPDQLENWEESRGTGKHLFLGYLRVLKAAGGRNGYLSHLHRKLVLSTDSWSDGKGQGMLEKNLGHTIPFMGELHDAFGGELWIDGILRCEGHAEAEQPFMRDP